MEAPIKSVKLGPREINRNKTKKDNKKKTIFSSSLQGHRGVRASSSSLQDHRGVRASCFRLCVMVCEMCGSPPIGKKLFDCT